jgi:hypothetical protein
MSLPEGKIMDNFSTIGAYSLQWVLVDEKLHHVSEFAHLPAKDRPNAICPVCREPVRMKLGDILVHHCAHMPGSKCVASVGETAVHLNTKLHLHRELKKGDKLIIYRKCVTCSNSHTVVWVRNYDDVHVECTVGSRRPDIALLSDHKVIGAVEVYVSHAVDPEKAEYFKANNINWIEVRGAPALYSGYDVWRIEKPLFVTQLGPDVKEWTCETCLEKQPKDAEERVRLRHEELREENKLYWKRRAIEMAEEHKRNNGPKLHVGRYYDFFHPDGTHARVLICVIRTLKDGDCIKIHIQTFEGKELFSVDGGDEQAQKEISRLFADYLNELKERKIIWDSPMSWIAAEQIAQLYLRDDPRFVWDSQKRRWVLPKENGDKQWKFEH